MQDCPVSARQMLPLAGRDKGSGKGSKTAAFSTRKQKRAEKRDKKGRAPRPGSHRPEGAR
jgi:hypothetical protein